VIRAFFDCTLLFADDFILICKQFYLPFSIISPEISHLSLFSVYP